MEKKDRRMSEGQTINGPDHPSSHQVEPEARISELWKSVLGLPQVGLDDSFFEVGGTSLLAAVLLSRINKAFEKNLPIAAVFECPTVRTMANLLRGGANSVTPSGEPAAVRPCQTISLRRSAGHRHHRHDGALPRRSECGGFLAESGERRRVDHLLRSLGAGSPGSGRGRLRLSRRARFSNKSICSMQLSLASTPKRLSRWIRSIGSFSSARGRFSSGRDTIHPTLANPSASLPVAA